MNGLPAELKGPASTIVDPDEQNAFKPLLPSEKSSFCQLTGKDIRLEFAGLPGRARANVAVLLIEPDSKRIYETLPSALRATWRDLTPDERIDLLKGGDAQVQRLLPDPAALNRWRQNRNLDVLKTQPRLAAELAVPGGETPEKIIEGLSVGDAGERLRRIMADTSFAVEATKSQFILETWNLVKGGKSPIDAMWQLQSKYALKGKEAKNDPKWDDIPLLKAIPTKWIGNYGKLDLSDLVACLNTAPKTDTEVPRKPDGSVDAAQARIKNHPRSDKGP